MRITRRLATLTVTAAAAAGLALTAAVPALAAAAPSTFLIGPAASHSGCEVTLFSARVSSRSPAQVFASVDSTHPGHACTAYVERSVTGKTAWAVASARVTLPSVPGLAGAADTGLVYDGPGYKARGCVRPAGSTAVTCTSALSLAKGAGTATSPALSPSWERKTAEVPRIPTGGGNLGYCAGGLASSTTKKKAGTTVLGLVVSATDPCTGWLQSTANGGKTWTTLSPLIPVTGPAYPAEAVAFTAHYADNPGHLARICVKDMTSKKENCSGSW